MRGERGHDASYLNRRRQGGVQAAPEELRQPHQDDLHRRNPAHRQRLYLKQQLRPAAGEVPARHRNQVDELGCVLVPNTKAGFNRLNMINTYLRQKNEKR